MWITLSIGNIHLKQRTAYFASRAGYEPLDTAIRVMAPGTSSILTQRVITQYGISIFDGKLFCFSGMVPYKYLFPRCVAAIHHGGRVKECEKEIAERISVEDGVSEAVKNLKEEMGIIILAFKNANTKEVKSQGNV
ncbi:hypothetical protein CUMW_205130 [Citrus unshiu]|uniref:Uncharacterized protein n=1 Tax=Citrus unshiu TaxID=55188 RepID=A0A2H5Q862_CITUN|nr:hypothetical protein CUMW_205130 [Citrus unshiu]